MTFNQVAYDTFLVENHVVGFYEDPITLRSGGKSFWYANFRSLLDDLTKVKKTAEFIHEFAKEKLGVSFTNYLAIPEGPREFTSSANRLLFEDVPHKTVPAITLRAGYKTHGSPLDRYTVGPVPDYMKPIVIEDVSTTGNSSSEFVMLLQELGKMPGAVISMLNRQERRTDGKTVQELFKNDYRVAYLSMTAAETVIPKAVEILKPNEKILRGLRLELGDLQRYTAQIKI